MQPDTDLNLEQIENDYWGEPGYPSYLVTTCHALRKKPLKDFTVEDLRILIGQNLSLDILLPLAVEKLKQNILAEGHMYPGDLLQMVLDSDHTYWQKNQALHSKLCTLYRHNLPSMEKRAGASLNNGTFKRLQKSFENFSRIEFSEKNL